MWTTRTFPLLAALGVLTTLPIAALADPPAVGAPGVPPVFVGAPTNDAPNAGQFTVNFDSAGDYLGIGTAPEPPLTIDLTRPRVLVVRQARITVPAATRDPASLAGIFAQFDRQLRDEAAPQSK
jgi:hypothetical protein